MKDQSNFRVVFMGTPEFAVPSLAVLVENGINVVGVITAPDKPKGRGKKLGTSPVKDYALSKGLNILQPTNLKDPTFHAELAALKADLQVVVAFRMLPVAVWDMPPEGTFNLHASLLPQYRGAAPINWAIINGEKETGITTFFLKHKIDTGDIIFQEKESIEPEDNVGTLYDRLMSKGSKLVLKTVHAIIAENYTLSPQVQSETLKAAPKIFRETCEIDWSLSAEKIHDFIRGLSPYPGAWTKTEKGIMKIYKTAIIPEESSHHPKGSYQTDRKHYLHFQTGDGLISVEELQLEGKKRMKIDELLRGQAL